MGWGRQQSRLPVTRTCDHIPVTRTCSEHIPVTRTCEHTPAVAHQNYCIMYVKADYDITGVVSATDNIKKHHNFCWRVRHNRKWRFRSSAILMGPLWCSVCDVILTSWHLMTSISALSALSNIQPVNNQAHCSLSEPLCYRVLWQKNVTTLARSLRRCITFGDVKCTKVPYHFSQFSLMLVDRQLARPTSNFNGRFV